MLCSSHGKSTVSCSGDALWITCAANLIAQLQPSGPCTEQQIIRAVDTGHA